MAYDPRIDRREAGKLMKTVTVTSGFRITLPREMREQLGLRPGKKLTVVAKGGVLFLIPRRPMRAYRGLAPGVNPAGLREKKSCRG